MKKNMPVLIIVIILLLGAAAAVYFFVLSPGLEANKAEPLSAYVPGEYFVTNIKDSNSLVKVTIVLQVNKAADDTEFQAFLKENNYIIRDTIVMIMRSKTLEELQAQEIKAILQEEIVAKVNENLGIDNVKTIYFNDYVIQ